MKINRILSIMISLSIPEYAWSMKDRIAQKNAQESAFFKQTSLSEINKFIKLCDTEIRLNQQINPQSLKHAQKIIQRISSLQHNKAVLEKVSTIYKEINHTNSSMCHCNIS